MKNESIERIRETFAALTPRADRVMEDFFTRFFEKRPQLRILFPHDMADLRRRLFGMLGQIVKHANYLGALEGQLTDLGARHAEYGVAEEHYPVFRDTLLETMRAAAGPVWSPRAEADWTEALNTATTLMRIGASSARARAA